MSSQDIIWKNADKSKILPNTIKINGVIEFYNGVISPFNELYIDQKNEFVYYFDKNSNTAFKIYDDEISTLGTPSFKNGENVKISQIFGEFSEEFFGALRKEIYNEVELNTFKITSVIRRPKYSVIDRKLDVSNKIVVMAKILSLRPNSIEFIDSDGNIIRQNTTKITMIEGGDDKMNRKLSRKKIRILDINFNNEVYLEINNLYDYFYDEYKKKYYQNLVDFKDSYLSKDFNNVLLDWGPFTEKFILNNGKTMYTWSFPQKYSESELVSRSTSSTLSSSSSSSITNANASLSSLYGINTDTQVKVSGYQGVINSYSSVRGNSFLSYYSSNVKNQYSVSSTTYNSQQKGSEIEIDISKKISLIVDSNDKIIEVLENNFFQEPYYGVLIKFYE
tara:strand:- start:149 stop:1324 length:1176 start_codon:yes stop_codon:yes gene_type:complete